MQSEFPSLSDTRPVVVLVVLGAALTCCCLLAAAAGAAFYWVEIGTVTPAAEAVSPAGAPLSLQQHLSRSPVAGAARVDPDPGCRAVPWFLPLSHTTHLPFP